MNKQKYTSKRTSGNRVAALHKKALKHNWILPGDRILDYGGGKYETSRNYLLKHDISCEIYDKYNRTIAHNDEVMSKDYDKVLCSNVLNVIAEKEVRQGIIKEMIRIAPIVLITIYKAPMAGATQNGKSYQLAKPLKFYANEILDMNLPVKITDNVILLLL